MNKKTRNTVKNYMTFDFDFAGIRIQEEYLTPVDWSLSVDLLALEKPGQTKEEAESNAAFAFQKVYFWLSNNLPGVVIVDVANEADMLLANICSNIPMFCPGEPGDELIIRLLHAKITSLTGDSLIVGPIRLKSTDSSLQYNYDCADGDYQLPRNTEEYYQEYPCRDMAPWWARDDGFSFEFARADTPEAEELYKSIVDPLDEFYSIVAEYSTKGMNKEPAKVIKVDKWKPKKV